MDEFLNVRQIANLALDSKAHGHSSFEMLVFYYRIFLRRACEIFAFATPRMGRDRAFAGRRGFDRQDPTL